MGQIEHLVMILVSILPLTTALLVKDKNATYKQLCLNVLVCDISIF